MNCNYITNKNRKTSFFDLFILKPRDNRSKEDGRGGKKRESALAGNRTRVARVASEHSTTEPPVLVIGLYRFAF